MTLKYKIEVEKSIIKTAKEKYFIALAEYDSVKNPITREHNNLLDKFRKIINNQIQADHDCDHCSPIYFDSAWITDDGISIRSGAKHPNDIIDRDYTWEEVEEILREG